ncbi:unnamed protein product [Linum tenue]|uniref:Uncharacterized protein n=1 Tax=Linum tenue TaxID=586396 RepID=A0AAV0H026_9ROSI|nr:unnamed protein product [Linum tenue]
MLVPPRHRLLQLEPLPEGHLQRHRVDPAGEDDERRPRGIRRVSSPNPNRTLRHRPRVLVHPPLDIEGESDWVPGDVLAHFLLRELRAQCDDVCGPGGDFPGAAEVDLSRDLGGGGEGRGDGGGVRVLVRGAVDGSGEDGCGLPAGDRSEELADCVGLY